MEDHQRPRLSDAPHALSLILVGRASAPAADFLQQTGAEIIQFVKGLTLTTRSTRGHWPAPSESRIAPGTRPGTGC